MGSIDLIILALATVFTIFSFYITQESSAFALLGVIGLGLSIIFWALFFLIIGPYYLLDNLKNALIKLFLNYRTK
jgi:hypothetical protein